MICLPQAGFIFAVNQVIFVSPAKAAKGNNKLRVRLENLAVGQATNEPYQPLIPAG
jgi:hypothetical protein